MKTSFFFRLRQSRWILVCCILVLMAMIAGAFFGIQALTDPYDCRIVDGVSIGGLELGGMKRSEARTALKTALEETLYSQDLTVSFPQRPLSPEQNFVLTPADSEITVNIRKAVAAAYRIGRSDDAGTILEFGLLPYITVNEAQIRTGLDNTAMLYDSELSPSQYSLEGDTPQLDIGSFDPDIPCQTLLITRGIPAAHMDVDAVYSSILEEYDRGIAECNAGTYGITADTQLEATPEEPDLQSIYNAFCTEAVNYSLDMETYVPVPGTYGYRFDLESAKAAVNAAAWGETVRISMEYVTPEIMGEAVYFRDVLGSCETKHSDDENRNTNLRLVCEILDGLVLQPGEEFSYNGVIGERTEERGFKSAGAYSGNRLVKDIGGGVCQGSSTLYNCVLLADLEVLERVCHGFTVTYLPIGLDAAVNWATKTDFRFRNNFHFPIMIRAELSDGYMKMQILGTDEKDYYIEMRTTRGDEELRIYSNSYKFKYDKETGELISKDLEARSSYMYFTG